MRLRQTLVFALLFLAVPTCPNAVAQPADRDTFPSETLLPSYLRERMLQRVASRRDSATITLLMQPLAARAGESTVEILSDGKRAALGTIVTRDGYVITKASELKPLKPVRLRLPNDRLVDADLIDQERSFDLALLKVRSAVPLIPIHWSDSEPTIGSFLYSVGREGDPVGIGVVSVASRKIEDRGLLGVMLQTDEDGARVISLVPGSGADDAGIKIRDLITHVEGVAMNTQKQVTEALRALYPGDYVRLSIRRAGRDDDFEVEAEIRELASLSESQDDIRVNGPRNHRLAGFEIALQHDTVLGPDQCGGPVIDTDGRVIGMNIARAGRVCSYAVPGSAIKLVVERMIAATKQQ
ncbi:MAG: PDZ domain-containing protein [Pirellulaceae bacterium]